MSDFSTIAAAIEAKLNGITNIGKIRIGWPLLVTWEDYLQQCKYTVGADDFIRVWVINRVRMVDQWVTQTQSYSVQEWHADGYFGYADGITGFSSEAGFQDFMEQVLAEFRKDYSLGDIVDVQEPPEMALSLELFGRVTCHVGRIILRYEVDKTF
jgi:hypothetical protein